MNNLRTPIALLVVVVLAFGAWIFYVHQAATPVVQQTSTNATTTSQVVPQTSQTALNPTPTLSEDAVATNIPGVWQSTDDPSYSVDITSNGKWTDDYKEAGSDTISESGTYTFFTSANPDPDFSGPVASGVVYIKLVEGGDIYYYSVIQASNNALQLTYLARGNTLSFTKVQ